MSVGRDEHGREGVFVSARFESFSGHRSVVVQHLPPGLPRAQVLFVPAFGDEMNQTRRMMRLAAESLAERSIASTLFDVHGTGDSSAAFEEASVERWLEDLIAMCERMRSAADVPLVLCGCRLGVALAVELTRRLSAPALALVGWAPVLQGRVQLSALLRAAKIAQQQRRHNARPDPKAEWAAGRIAFLGGYPVSAALAAQLERLDTSEPPRVHAVTLVDVRPPIADGVPTPSEGLQGRARAWREQGVDAEVLAIAGAPFWNVPDLVDLTALVETTVRVTERHLAEAAQ